MPSFTTTIANLQRLGPQVQLRIAVGRAAEELSRRAGEQVPPSIQASALIDTGATGSVIREGMAGQLGLHPVGVTPIVTASSTGPVECYEYLVRLVFPNNVVYEGTVHEAPLLGQRIQCLVGRDVLSRGVFVYIGYGNLFSLSF